MPLRGYACRESRGKGSVFQAGANLDSVLPKPITERGKRIFALSAPPGPPADRGCQLRETGSTAARPDQCPLGGTASEGWAPFITMTWTCPVSTAFIMASARVLSAMALKTSRI